MNILLGVCGSISAYKSFDILRGLLKNGHVVKVVCTKGAENFVIPQVFKYLGASEVFHAIDDFSYPDKPHMQGSGTVLHIDLAKWADKIMIAPLSANTLASLAHGFANDLLSSIFLASSQKTPIILFPAMNTQMFEHPITQENIDLVKKIEKLPQVFFHQPDEGLLACGDSGIGKLPSVETIVDFCEASHNKIDTPKKILITTGATLSTLDPVRYLTNASSGLTGYELAVEALSLGHKVVVIAGKNATKSLNSLIKHPHYILKRVVSTEDMAVEVKSHFSDSDVYISAAAINDISFKASHSKLKKNEICDHLKIEQTQDILKNVLALKSQKQFIVGFAAETSLTNEVLEKKYNNKPVNLLIGTHVHHGLLESDDLTTKAKGFGTPSARYSILEDGKIDFEGILSKKELAKLIINKAICD